jgi:imidazolonepropionase-like amidohydrolase
VLGAAGTISGRAQQPGPERHNALILHSAQLLDVKTGTTLSDQIIVIDGDTITAVGPAKSLKTNTDAERIELPNATVLPGLIDFHVHLTGNPNQQDLGRAVFTSRILGAH